MVTQVEKQSLPIRTREQKIIVNQVLRMQATEEMFPYFVYL